jgi:FkbM family methyltransferase
MNQLLRKVRIALTPRDRLLKSRLSNGAVVYGKNRTGFGGRGVFVSGDALEPELEHLERYLDAEGVFIDVGANTGVYALKAARHYNGRGIVIAIEPFIDVLATLSYSVQRNRFKNVRLRNFAVSSKTEEVVFWMNFGRPHSFSLKQREEDAHCLSVEAVALDDLFAWEHLDRLDFLKIDAEGAEADILAGARNIIATCRPIVLMEVNIEEARFQEPGYSIFQAPNSPNQIYIPDESSKIGVPQQLGWAQIGHSN